MAKPPSPSFGPQQALAAWEKFSPVARVILLPPMLGGMNRFDFDLLWSQLRPQILEGTEDKSLAALQMVERWAREAEEFARVWNPELEDESL